MSEIEREVHARVQAAADKEIHVSTVWSCDEYPEAGLCAEVREYSPSTEAFGRGITFPLNKLHRVMEGLESIWFSHGAGAEQEATDPGHEVDP
ncbi:hypothetical protein ACFVXW_16760 [Streptomyces sp. NPDC058251]|uniref:hypothetical protein n=1 Tax=Streptomyces sp. NPDC058251 TaxID=3346404 RepID=UPI0036EEFAE2